MNAVNNTTIGTRIGAAIGKSAAYTAHAAIKTAQGTGRFGQDVMSGTQTGYEVKSAELAAARATALAQRQAPLAIKIVRKTKVAA